MKQSFWNPERDRRLVELRRAGMTMEEVALKLGTTRSAVIGRSVRLRGLKFPSIVARIERERRDRATRATVRRQNELRQIEQLLSAMAAGRDRDTMIADAADAGVRYRVIGEAIGVTRQRIEQIVSSSRFPAFQFE